MLAVVESIPFFSAIVAQECLSVVAHSPGTPILAASPNTLPEGVLRLNLNLTEFAVQGLPSGRRKSGPVGCFAASR